MKELNSFLKQVDRKPFQWGAWDCLIFTNEAFRKMHGEGWADDLLNRYLQGDRLLTRSQIRKEYGYDDVESMLRDRLVQAYDIPPRGALVLSNKANMTSNYLGVSFGLAVGMSAAFLSEQGLVYCPIETIDSAWVKQ